MFVESVDVRPGLSTGLGPLTETIGARLRREGRAQVPDILNLDYAESLREAALRADYNTVTRRGSGHVDLPRAWLDSLAPVQRQGLGQVIQESAAEGFQYLFDSYPIHDLHGAGQAPTPWAQLVDFLNGSAFLDLMREITGEPRIAMADAQLTRFRKGHFLNSHDDGEAGKNRYFAYVLGLTPGWRLDWGGLLAFEDETGNVAEAFTPRFNALNLLKVPQPHSVTQVALSAGHDRIAVSGWLRGV